MERTYLVVWAGRPFAALCIIYGVPREPWGGVVLDQDPIPIAGNAAWADGAAIAFDGNRTTSWLGSDLGAGLDIHGARVSPAGVVLDPGGIPRTST